MMISPERFIEKYKDKPYVDLLQVRDRLIKEIQDFELGKLDLEFDEVQHPSPDVVYQSNLLYLAKLCEVIAEKYREKLWKEYE